MFRRTPFDRDANGNQISGGNVIGADNQLLYDGTYGYEYDADGNRVAQWKTTHSSETAPGSDATDITIYTWDYQGDLTGETHFTTFANYGSGTSDWSVGYSYDAEGRMICEEADENGATTYSYTVYDGQNAYLQVTDATSVGGKYIAADADSQRLVHDVRLPVAPVAQSQDVPQLVFHDRHQVHPVDHPRIDGVKLPVAPLGEVRVACRRGINKPAVAVRGRVDQDLVGLGQGKMVAGKRGDDELGIAELGNVGGVQSRCRPAIDCLSNDWLE